MNRTDRRGRSLLQRGLALAFLAATGGALACDSADPSQAETRDPADVEALALDSTAPLLFADSVSFYAVYGEERRGEIFFRDSSGQPGERLLRFEIDKTSLFRFPDGRRFQDGDSVLITIKVADPGSLQFDFEPSGLRFSLQQPAELEIEYGHAIGDVQDEEGNLAVWMQEADNLPYLRLPSRVNVDGDDIEADVPGFSKYAVAY